MLEVFYPTGNHGLHWGTVRMVFLTTPVRDKLDEMAHRQASEKYFEAATFKYVDPSEGDIIT
jgi:hypothetical protein